MPGRWNIFNSGDDSVSAPASSAEVIVPHATNPLPFHTRSIYVGLAGNLVVRMVDDDNDTTFSSVPAGTILPIRCSHVRATSTASQLVALF